MSCRVARHTSRSGRVPNYLGHRPGLGLLLLRSALGITTAVQAAPGVASPHDGALRWIVAAAVIAGGLALTLGIFTRLCSALLSAAYIVVLLPGGGTLQPRLDGVDAIVGLAAVVALGLLGPGTYSIDAHLFGRREIFIPAPHRSRRRGDDAVPPPGDAREER